MEIILAIVVASAVIFFGALISLGNERQRKSIDGLREQLVLWAMQDLKIKQKHLSQTVRVPDPLLWFNNVALRACGYDLQLSVLETCDEPQALVCLSSIGNTKIIFSPFSPAALRRIKDSRQSRLAQFADHNPLLFLPKTTKVYEVSVLNAGHLFDLELSLAWKALTGQNLDLTNRLWLYKHS